jgi:hypothetical protein
MIEAELKALSDLAEDVLMGWLPLRVQPTNDANKHLDCWLMPGCCYSMPVKI